MALNTRSGGPGEPPDGEITGGKPSPPAGSGPGGRTGPRVPPADQEDLLPCGRRLSDVWEAWDRGRTADDPHLAVCPYCGAALADLTALAQAVHQSRGVGWIDEPADLTDRIMDVVRLELRPGRTLPLGGPDEDSWIVEAAAARVFRAAADSLDGVRAGSCRISPAARRDSTAGPGRPDSRGPVAIRIQVVAAPHRNLPELAGLVRTQVAVAARAAIGIEVDRVDVMVVDLFDSDSDSDSGGGDGDEGDSGGEGDSDTESGRGRGRDSVDDEDEARG